MTIGEKWPNWICIRQVEGSNPFTGSISLINKILTVIRCRLRQSLSAQGNCYDNAQAESFFSRFKTEVDMRIFRSVEEARSEAFDYIECYYNLIHRNSGLCGSIPQPWYQASSARVCWSIHSSWIARKNWRNLGFLVIYSPHWNSSEVKCLGIAYLHNL